ncbi:RagB/SusD family nutrient uptake outer membrane protein [Dyadobacter sp. CY323]|uniref:RagB/SusD family nutrient uptake outer membrane protein n=1 Tax=Dyadobacter sp. CY323 TaxID=2907302 RepID=UPI001F1A1762|nr:RagB/SusD family nutrient uptake outer membrane protein [Dyadobacter sp. CY323]MCE6990155.1 RagB/SusD family nutrient uptake outer membrane protein [Dyadobacter sp. CY323]
MMKNITSKFLTAGCLISLLAIPSCKKDFLEIGAIGTVNETTLANKEGVNRLLIGAYSLLDENGGAPGASYFKSGTNFLYSNIASDEAHAGTLGNLPNNELIEAWRHDASNVNFGFKWAEIYAGVQRANDVLRVLAQIPEGSISADEALQIKAEAVFLRAVYHFNAIKMWRNVPYLDETVSFGNNNFLVSNTEPAWPKVEADFQFAAANLTPTKPDAGRGNSWAAKAFLAKVYMFQNKFTEAKPLLADLIANGVTASGKKYALVNYSDNFNPVKQNNSESVFSVQNSVKDGSSGANGNNGDVISIPLVPGAGGSGSNQPSFSLVNSFKTDPATGLPLLDTFNDSDIKHDQGLAATDPFTPYAGTVDPRLDWTVGRRDIPLMDHGLFGRYWILYQDIGGPYGPKKNMFYLADAASTSESIGWSLATANNYNMIRFADILLWAAEVEVEIGSLTEAEKYVNMIRARAANVDDWVKTYVDNANPSKGFTTKPAANYKIGLYAGQFAAQGKEFARKAVRFERKIELAMEGHRFFDLQRWDNGTGYMADVLNAYLAHETKIPGFVYSNRLQSKFIKGKHELYPIPQKEIDLSVREGASVLKQNPGFQ